MTSTDLLFDVRRAFRRIGIFLYGMSAMSGGLEQITAAPLDRTLKKVTKNGFISFLVGAGMTIAIQSSSAMTVMLVGLVNSGIMEFADTFGMIMGSHVGTTLTSWILTLTGIQGDNFFLTLLKPMTFAPHTCPCGSYTPNVCKKGKKTQSRSYTHRLCRSHDGNGHDERLHGAVQTGPGLPKHAHRLHKPHACLPCVNSGVYRRYSVVGRHRSHCSGNDPCRRRNRLSHYLSDRTCSCSAPTSEPA